MSPQPGESSHRRFLRSVLLILLAAVGAVAAGCASEPKDTKEYAKGGAEIGAGAGMEVGIICGPFAIICGIPFAVVGAVAGGVVGATVGAVKDAGKSSSTATRSKHPSFVAWLPASDFSPSGDLLIDNSDTRASGSHEFSGSLVVNLDKPLDDSTKSIVEDIVVVCTTGEVTFHWRRWYDDLNASGNILRSEPASVPIRPGPELDAVKRSFCGSSSNA